MYQYPIAVLFIPYCSKVSHLDLTNWLRAHWLLTNVTNTLHNNMVTHYHYHEFQFRFCQHKRIHRVTFNKKYFKTTQGMKSELSVERERSSYYYDTKQINTNFLSLSLTEDI